MYAHAIPDKMYKEHINALLTNDWEHVKLGNFERRPENIDLKRAWRAKKNAESAKATDTDAS
jgi:hypothetical protein